MSDIQRNPSAPAIAPEAGIQPTGYLTARDLQRTVFTVFALIGALYMAGPLTTLLLFFLLVFILSAVLNPVAAFFQKRGVPRLMTALVMAVLILGFLVLLGYLVMNPLLDEVSKFSSRWGDKEDRLLGYYEGLIARYPQLKTLLPGQEQLRGIVTPQITKLAGAVGKYTLNLVGLAVSLVLMLVLVIFTVGKPEPLIAGLLGAVPERHQDRTATALRRILEQLKNWAFGSLILGVIVGLMSAIGLWVVSRVTGKDIPYILLFSVIAGVGEMVPNIGPIISALPPVLIALTVDPMLAVWVMVLYVVIQQLENNLIVPLVMGQSLNLHPLSVTFTVLVMGALFGLLGAILAVPLCAIIKVCWEEFYLIPRGTDTDALQRLAGEIVSSGSPDPRDRPRKPQLPHLRRGTHQRVDDLGDSTPVGDLPAATDSAAEKPPVTVADTNPKQRPPESSA